MNEAPFFAIAFLGVGACLGAFWVYLIVKTRSEELWRCRQIAGRAGLTDVAQGRLWSLGGVMGRAGSLLVRLEGAVVPRAGASDRRKREFGSGTLASVVLDSDLTLRRESAEPELRDVFGPAELQLGDERFDDAVYMRGSAETLRAVLDVETRGAVLEALGGGLRVAGTSHTLPADVSLRDGRLEARFPPLKASDAPDQLAGALKTLVALARRLQRPADPVGRIATNTEREPEWRVRLENLRLLAHEHPRHPATREALKRCCQDERGEVQLVAALGLGGSEAKPVLLDIATREWSGDREAARAVAALGEELPAERAQSILSHALRTRRHLTAKACLESLGRLGRPELIEPLEKVLAVDGGELGVVAARALGSSRLPAAEAPLLEALGSASPDVRLAAAEALGSAGTPGALLRLKELAAAPGVEPALRRAARQAAAEIQARLPGASPGQLSLAEGDAGQLSLAGQDPTGRVSLVPPKRGPERAGG